MKRRVDTRDAAGREFERAEPFASDAAVRHRTRVEQDEEHPSPISAPSARGGVASFGPFRLHVIERLLEKNGAPVKIGSRALDILVTLLEQAPEVVSKQDLNRRAWGRLIVEEGSIRVHIARLRKRLHDEASSASHIVNIPGRGYSFTGAVAWSVSEATARNAPVAALRLPRKPLLMVGRDDAVRELAARLKEQRFVSIIGPGGIGKTTVALALAHRMLGEVRGAIHFVDLGALEDPRLLASMLASQLGVVAASDQPLPSILTFLRGQRVLLVFDSCEHVVGAVAALTENIFRDAPDVYILTTSREALRAEGEQVHHLPPLECPPDYEEPLTAVQALSFPAVQLFVKQVANSVHPFELTDADAPIVAEICRRLDGIALALELAASRVGVHGVRGVASLLDKHFRLLWRGRRTALARHQTLSAALGWSYNLLSETEQLVFRRLAIFVGDFSLAAAVQMASEGLDPAELTETVATLVDKSLVTSDGGSAASYRLLETTRAYAWQKLSESGEDQKIVRRHWEQLAEALEKFGAQIWARPSPDSITFFTSNLSSLRAALDWCFSDHGGSALGARLSGAAASLFFQAGLLPECVTWSERAVGVLGPDGAGTRLELELLACLSQSRMLTSGNIPSAHAAIVRALDIARRLEAAPMELYLLHGLYKWQIRSGDFCGLEELTERIATVAKQVADPLANAIANAASATTHFYTGNHREVQKHADIALAAPVHLSRLNPESFAELHRIRAISAPNLWALGFPDRAMETVAEAVQEAEQLNHPLTLCHMLMSCTIVPLRTGNWQRAEELIRRLSYIATKHGLLTYSRACVGFEGRLAISRNDLCRGIHLLQTAKAAMHQDGYELYRPQAVVSLAEGLARAGQLDVAYGAVQEEIAWVRARGRVVDLIDLLCVKSEILSSMAQQDASEGLACLLQALEVAQQRGLLSLELRSAIGLAKLWADRGEADRALGLLEPIFSRFSEGFQTLDLIAADNLLAKLRSL